MERHFPVYRKYPNNKSYFKVLSEEQFEEIQLVGRYYRVEAFEAKIMPDRFLVKDIIELEGGHWAVSSEEEYESVLQDCRLNRIEAK